MGALEVAGEVAPISPGEHVELPAHGRGQVEQQHDGGVGHPLGGIGRDVAHGDAPGPGGGQVDVVVASARLAQQIDGVGESGEELRPHGHLLGHHDAAARHPLQHLVLGRVVVDRHRIGEDGKVQLAVIVHLGSVEHDCPGIHEIVHSLPDLYYQFWPILL